MADEREGGSGELTRAARLEIYRAFVETGRAPSLLDLSRALGLAPSGVEAILERLQDEAAIVLVPGSPYLWMAEPFSAVPTAFPVMSGERTWFGNCIWDALAILALVERPGRVETLSPVDGEPLRFEVREGRLQPVEAVIHFAVPARDWWRSIGFT
jgi:hypothetical protein